MIHAFQRRSLRRADPGASPDSGDRRAIYGDISRRHAPIALTIRSLGCSQQAATVDCAPSSTQRAAHFIQSHDSKLQRCRRPLMHAALRHGLHHCEDGLLRRLMSERDLVSQPLRPRRAGYFLIGFEDARRRLGPESLAESQRWGLLPQDATPARQQGTQSRPDGTKSLQKRMQCSHELKDKQLRLAALPGCNCELFGSVPLCRRRLAPLSR
jgi:hypothetical protein